MLDLKKIEDELSPRRVIELVTFLGADRYEERKDYIIFPTLCHNINVEEASMKLYYYFNSHRFVCYTDCGDSFSIYELFRRRYELLNKEYNFYRDIVLVIYGKETTEIEENGFYSRYESDLNKFIKQEINVNFPKLNPNLLNVFTFYPTVEWLNDGISEESMKEYQIKYSVEQNKIVIPHYDEIGNLIGIRSRILNEEELAGGKYLPMPIEGKLYNHPLGFNLYGLNFIKGNIKRFKMAIIAESEKACLQYNTMFGHLNNICVATCGSSVHRYQIELLIKAGAEKILIAFDKEGKTWKEKSKYFDKLRNICLRYKNICRMGFIVDNKNLLGLKDSPFDKGKEIFLELYKGAIWL